MAAAEALNTMHCVQDKVTVVDDKVHGVQSTVTAIGTRMEDFEARIKDVESRLLGAYDKGADIRDKAKSSANTILNGYLYLSTLICLGAAEPGRQKTTNFYAVAVECLHGVGDDGQTEELELVWNRTKHTVARTIDGAQVILNQSSPPH
jgi:hypothetical protein